MITFEDNGRGTTQDSECYIAYQKNQRLHLNNFKIKMINYSGDSSHRFLPHESKQFSSGVTLNKINQGCRTNDTNVHLAAAKVVCSPPSFINNVVKHDKK